MDDATRRRGDGGIAHSQVPPLDFLNPALSRGGREASGVCVDLQGRGRKRRGGEGEESGRLHNPTVSLTE